MRQGGEAGQSHDQNRSPRPTGRGRLAKSSANRQTEIPASSQEAVLRALLARTEAAEANANALELMTAAVHSLVANGMSHRESALALGVSHTRVSQLLRDDSERRKK